ncbi:ABC transporter permease [Streptomyces sp. NBC_01408]|uniref:ABC transporter permease n=1 Tax=Streptomyces sp. NBC_01408 TaxID=2903855 RepID=UPI00225157DD|nr:ABC transporter permease [Streptomyces sp. NBC_01408]MCX4692914.1 ABC transporter permease [Streptomyces sp. NBC_01408]
MSTAIRAGSPAPATNPARGGGFAGAVGAEWTKLWSIRTPYVCLLVGLLVTVIFCYYYGAISEINDKPIQPVGNAPVSAVILTQFAVLVLAMTMVTSEYATSSVRTSLMWVPVRHRVQLAKALVGSVVGFVLGIVYSVIGVALAWSPFQGHASFDMSKVTAQVLAVGVYCALVGVMSVGVAFALRTAAATVAVLFFIISALPSMLTGLGGDFLLVLNDYMPQTAGGVFMLGKDNAPYSPMGGLLIVVVWAVASHVVGTYVLRKRDA